MRLSLKIPLVIMLCCLVAGAFGSAFMAAGLASEVRDAFERRSVGLVQALAANSASAMAARPPDDQVLQQGVDNLESFGHGAAMDMEWIAFVDCEGRVVAHSDPRRYGTFLSEVVPDRLLCGSFAGNPPGGTAGTSGEAAMIRGADRLLIAAPVRLETRSGTAVASFSLAEVATHEARGRWKVFLGVALLAVVLAAALSALLRRTVARRLSVLTTDTEALRHGDLDRRSAVAGTDEVGQLAGAFNAMAERLAGYTGRLEEEVRERTRDLRAVNEELARLATTDALTGLLNRRKMQDVLLTEMERHRRKGRTLSIVMVDLDHFKRFNDAHGHLAGDSLLRALGERLRSRQRIVDSAARIGAGDSVRDPARADDQAARYGGEEFVLILPETEKRDAGLVAERVRASLEREPLLPREKYGGPVTLSAGVASFPADGGDPDSVLRVADEALYAAKAAGRNRIVVAPDGGAARQAECDRG
ncbi:MAG: diguanylate cyclase [Myxococcota bacterium]|nr:diguanylate cyclase [Myxococcota bacterium]